MKKSARFETHINHLYTVSYLFSGCKEGEEEEESNGKKVSNFRPSCFNSCCLIPM